MQIPAQEASPHWVAYINALSGPVGAAIGSVLAKMHTLKRDRERDKEIKNLKDITAKQTSLLEVHNNQIGSVLDGARDARRIAESTRDCVNRIAGKLGVEGTR